MTVKNRTNTILSVGRSVGSEILSRKSAGAYSAHISVSEIEYKNRRQTRKVSACLLWSGSDTAEGAQHPVFNSQIAQQFASYSDDG